MTEIENLFYKLCTSIIKVWSLPSIDHIEPNILGSNRCPVYCFLFAKAVNKVLHRVLYFARKACVYLMAKLMLRFSHMTI